MFQEILKEYIALNMIFLTDRDFILFYFNFTCVLIAVYLVCDAALIALIKKMNVPGEKSIWTLELTLLFNIQCILFLDIDECEVGGVCSQKCNNSIGSYTCSCFSGYQLNDDKTTCSGALCCFAALNNRNNFLQYDKVNKYIDYSSNKWILNAQ